MARLREELSHDEYVRWRVYLGRKAQRQQLEDRKARNKKGGKDKRG